MADVTVTAAEVLPTSTTEYATGEAGETITAGEPLYKKSGDGNALWKCDADTSAESDCVGVSMCGGANGQQIVYAVAGTIDPGFTAVVGEAYAVSATVGRIAPVSDITTSGDFITFLGIATSASALKLSIFAGKTARG